MEGFSNKSGKSKIDWYHKKKVCLCTRVALKLLCPKTNEIFDKMLDIQNQREWRKLTIVRDQNKYTKKINHKFKNK